MSAPNRYPRSGAASGGPPLYATGVPQPQPHVSFVSVTDVLSLIDVLSQIDLLYPMDLLSPVDLLSLIDVISLSEPRRGHNSRADYTDACSGRLPRAANPRDTRNTPSRGVGVQGLGKN